jgi:hypothetical protein
MKTFKDIRESLKLKKATIAHDNPTWKIMDGSGYTGWNVVKDGANYHLETEYGDRPARDIEGNA